MKLLILTYHRITDSDNPFSAQSFSAYLKALVQHYPLWAPDSLPSGPGPLALYLTFDDATFDFYHFVYPLLKQLQIQVLLAIPTARILESSTAPLAVRLAPLAEPYHAGQGHELCTWTELREMVASGHVKPASHSHNHFALPHRRVVLATELVHSRVCLEEALQVPIDTFVYPYGKKNFSIVRQTLRHYRYAMRMGGALHPGGWPSEGLLYRANGDYLASPLLPAGSLRHYHFNYWLNRGRLR